MADIRQVDIDEGLDALRSELKYTELRLLSREATRAFAAPFTALLDRWPAVRDWQLAAWDAEDAADVAVANADDDLDDLVPRVEAAAVRFYGAKDSPGVKRYMGEDTSKSIQRLGLESQLGRTADWAASLGTLESGAGSISERMAAVHVAGHAALAQRVAAGGARADHRLRVIQTYFDDANALRISTYGALLSYAAEHGLATDWARRPFRRGRRRSAKSGD